MPATVEEVKKMIQEAFPGSEHEIDERDHSIGGLILWKEFKTMDPRERNRLVTERVRGKLGREGLNLGILVPLADRKEM